MWCYKDFKTKRSDHKNEKTDELFETEPKLLGQVLVGCGVGPFSISKGRDPIET